MRIFLELLGKKGLPCLTWKPGRGLRHSPEGCGMTRMTAAILLLGRDSQELPKVGCGEELHAEPQGETRKSDKRAGEK